MKFRRFIFAALAALIAASPSFAAVPRYVEGEAIVIYKTEARHVAARELSAADSAPDAGAELGVELLQS